MGQPQVHNLHLFPRLAMQHTSVDQSHEDLCLRKCTNAHLDGGSTWRGQRKKKPWWDMASERAQRHLDKAENKVR